MKTPSHRDRLIASLPADLQAGALDACHKISEDGNDGVVGMFAADIESTQRGFAGQREDTQRSTAQLLAEIQMLREKIVESDQRHRGEIAQAGEREKKLMAEIAKGHTETLKTVHSAISALIGMRLFRRVNITQLTGALIWLAVMIGSNFTMKNKVWTLNPQQVEGIQSSINEQTSNFEKLTENQKRVVDYIESVSKTNDIRSSHTIVGEHLAEHITEVDRNAITLTVPDESKAGGITAFRVPHNMTEEEYYKLKSTYVIPKKFK